MSCILSSINDFATFAHWFSGDTSDVVDQAINRTRDDFGRERCEAAHPLVRDMLMLAPAPKGLTHGNVTDHNRGSNLNGFRLGLCMHMLNWCAYNSRYAGGIKMAYPDSEVREYTNWYNASDPKDFSTLQAIDGFRFWAFQCSETILERVLSSDSVALIWATAHKVRASLSDIVISALESRCDNTFWELPTVRKEHVMRGVDLTKLTEAYGGGAY